MGGHFSGRKISGKNFLTTPTLERGIPKWIFPFFMGVTFEMLHFNFCCANAMGFLQGHFSGSIFWGKKFATNCSAYIAKNPRGPVGEGVQGGVWGSTWGNLPGM